MYTRKRRRKMRPQTLDKYTLDIDGHVPATRDTWPRDADRLAERLNREAAAIYRAAIYSQCPPATSKRRVDLEIFGRFGGRMPTPDDVWNGTVRSALTLCGLLLSEFSCVRGTVRVRRSPVTGCIIVLTELW